MRPDKYARKVARRRMDRTGEDYRTALSRARRFIETRNSDPRLMLYVASLWAVLWPQFLTLG